MARCRGSSRKAPSPRSDKKRVTRSMNSINKSTTIEKDGMPMKRHIDDSRDNDEHNDVRSGPDKTRHIMGMPTPDEGSRQEEEAANAGSSTNNTSVPKSLGGRLSTAYKHNFHSETQASLAGTGTPVVRPATKATSDRLENQNSIDEPAWKALAPAPFEANEIRRAEKYKRENMRLDRVHDGVVARSLAEKRSLLNHWEDSKVIRPMKRKNSRTRHENPEAAATIKDACSYPPLEGEGRKLSLSPVFPIRSPAPKDELDSLDLDGSRLWPIDLPEPCIVEPPLTPVLRLPVTLPMRPQTVRRQTLRFRQGEGPQSLRERYQYRRYQATHPMEEEMSEEEMSVFLDYDTKH